MFYRICILYIKILSYIYCILILNRICSVYIVYVYRIIIKKYRTIINKFKKNNQEKFEV